MFLLDGRVLAKNVLDKLKQDVGELNRQPKLAVMLVGSDPASHLYVRLKKERAEEIGIKVEVKMFFSTTPETELIKEIIAWNNDPAVAGILVQLPLPDDIDTNRVTSTINPDKDVDGFHCENTQKLKEGDRNGFIPPVHAAVLELIRSTGLDLNGKTATILGNSGIFTQPLQLLLKKNAIAADIVVHPPEDTTDLSYNTDIVIVALGRPAWLKASMVKGDAIIIDVGTNRLEEGPTIGDVDADDLKDTPGWLSPVPGGVGPLTVAFLLKNVVQAARTNWSAQ